jgi:outer membrane protein assembly factor BamB
MNTSRLTFMAALLAVSSLASSLSPAADWPRWRGANFDDQCKETGLLKTWPAGGPKKVWLFENAGLGYSGFAVVGDTLFTMGARDAMEYVIAVDVKTGKEKWSSEAGPLLTNNWGNGPRSTPTVDGGMVYAMSGKGHLSCFNAADGKLVWKVTMEELGGKVPGWGYTESVLVDGNLVVCTPGGSKGSLAAFDKTTGKKVWQSTEWVDGAQYSSIVPASWNGVRQLIQLTGPNFGAVDAANGKLLWKTPFPGKTAVIPSPIFSDGHVFVAAGYGAGCKMVTIGANNELTEGYSNTDMVNHHGGVLLYQGNLYGYCDGKGWTCMDFSTGAVKWHEKAALKKGAIHFADGKLYLLEEDSGNVVLADASPDGWKENSRFKLEPQTTQRSKSGKIWTHPVVSGGKLYLRDQELLFCFDVAGQ